MSLPISPLKLSDAIRLGAMSLKPLVGRTVLYDTNDTLVGACALAGALHAIGWCCVSLDMNTIWKAWPWMSKTDDACAYNVDGRRFVQCPACRREDPVIDVIVELNDEHLWTRERIADWVATIEPQDVIEQQPIAERIEHATQAQ
jgi:hypothetical protein